jgi:hypothetical protein
MYPIQVSLSRSTTNFRGVRPTQGSSFRRHDRESSIPSPVSIQPAITFMLWFTAELKLMLISFWLFADPNLMKPLFPVILRAVLTSVGVLGAMFIFTYLPQVAVLAFVTGPLGEFWVFGWQSAFRSRRTLINICDGIDSFHRCRPPRPRGELYHHHVPHQDLPHRTSQYRPFRRRESALTAFTSFHNAYQ